jgi:hypothetical protein
LSYVLVELVGIDDGLCPADELAEEGEDGQGGVLAVPIDL